MRAWWWLLNAGQFPQEGHHLETARSRVLHRSRELTVGKVLSEIEKAKGPPINLYLHYSANLSLIARSHRAELADRRAKAKLIPPPTSKSFRLKRRRP